MNTRTTDGPVWPYPDVDGAEPCEGMTERDLDAAEDRRTAAARVRYDSAFERAAPAAVDALETTLRARLERWLRLRGPV